MPALDETAASFVAGELDRLAEMPVGEVPAFVPPLDGAPELVPVAETPEGPVLTNLALVETPDAVFVIEGLAPVDRAGSVGDADDPGNPA